MQREKAESDFDQLKSSGAPEYVVSIREVKADGSRTAWSPVGGIAVPRSGSECAPIPSATPVTESRADAALLRAQGPGGVDGYLSERRGATQRSLPQLPATQVRAGRAGRVGPGRARPHVQHHHDAMPSLIRASTDKFEYGYRLKEFPDDPVKIASEEKTKETTNPIMQWFNTLDNPLNRE